MFNTENMGKAAIFITLLVSIGIVAYQTVMHEPVDSLFTGIMTLILGKYIQQIGFDAGTTSSSILTSDAVSKGVVIGLNGGPAAQLAATKENTAAIVNAAAPVVNDTVKVN